MKRTQFRYIVPTLIIFILSLLCTSASAYQVNKTSEGADIKWGTNNATYYINTSGGPSDSLAAIQAAMQTWTDVSTSSFYFIYGGTTSNTAFGANDGINIVCFESSSMDYVWEYYYWYYVNSGQILDCDLKLNKNYPWGTDGSANKFDVQNVGTSLFGNALSLALLFNSTDSEKTMYGYTSYGETKKRTLEQDDIDGITYLYPLSIPPTATTGTYQIISSSSAQLFGTVNPNGLSTDGWFEWGTTISYGNKTDTQSLGDGTSVVQMLHTIFGLSASTTYHFRAVGQNSAGTSYGDDMTFTTPSPAVVPPKVTTEAATSVTSTSATLNGTVNPNGAATTGWFEWGTTSSYGNTTQTFSGGSGSSPVTISWTITGLSSKTTYHCRAVGQNSAGTTNGSDMTFTTKGDVQPTVTTGSATDVTSNSATLNGTVNANGLSTTAEFVYRLSGSYSSSWYTSKQTVSGSSDTSVSIGISGLSPGTSYYYRIEAENSAGRSYGNGNTFTTFTVTTPPPTPTPTPTPTVSPTPSTTLTPATCSDSYEPNDSSSQAYGYLSSGSSYSGKICSGSDVDWFKVNITSAGTISLSLTVPSSNDYELDLLDASDARVASSTNGSGVSELINYDATSTGNYYIKIYGFSSSNTTDSYTLTYTFTSTTSATPTPTPTPSPSPSPSPSPTPTPKASPSPTPSTTPTLSPLPTPTPTTTPEEEDLLEKYAPILYMHEDERFYPIEAKVMLDNSNLYKKEDDTVAFVYDRSLTSLDYLMNNYNENTYYLKLKDDWDEGKDNDFWKSSPTIYGRKFNSSGLPVLQYWFFYIYNDWDNIHEGDWEMIQITLKKDYTPKLITYSIHKGGKTFRWNVSKVRKVKDHPLVYVTLGGHGSWNKADNNTWFQGPGKCIKCTDKTSALGDVLVPSTMSLSSDKYKKYQLEDLSAVSENHWIYWEGYWGDINNTVEGIKKLSLPTKGPSSPPYVDYINKVKEGERSINGRWYKPFPWAIIPRPSNYKICASANSKFTIFDLETNEPVSVIFEHCGTPDIGSKCGQCSNISIIYSKEDLGFNVYSLDGKEVDLIISRYKSTGEVYDIEFNWLEIPKNGKATLRFSPDENPNLEMEIDHDHNGIFDYRVSPDYVKFR